MNLSMIKQAMELKSKMEKIQELAKERIEVPIKMSSLTSSSTGNKNHLHQDCA